MPRYDPAIRPPAGAGARETHDIEHDTHVRPGGARHRRHRPVHWNLVPRRCSTSTPCAAKKGWWPPTGPLVCRTGQHTGRSPNDKFVVRSRRARPTSTGARSTSRCRRSTSPRCAPTSSRTSGQRELFVQNLHAGADPVYRLPVRMISELRLAQPVRAQPVHRADRRGAGRAPARVHRDVRADLPGQTRPATAPAPTSSSPSTWRRAR